MSAFTVYLLHDPTEPGVAYVGMTGTTVEQRIRRHMMGAVPFGHKVQRWLHARRASHGRGWKPRYRVLAVCEVRAQARDLERLWIARLKAAGAPELLNVEGVREPKPKPCVMPRAEWLARARAGTLPYRLGRARGGLDD